MTSKLSHHLITLLMLICVSIQQRHSLQKMAYAYNVIDLMVDSNLKLPENGVTYLRHNGDVRFYISARAL